MLGRYNAAVIEEALRATTTAPPFPSADDRPAWAAIGDRLGPAQVPRSSIAPKPPCSSHVKSGSGGFGVEPGVSP